MRVDVVLAAVAVVELLVIAVLAVSRSRTSPRERLLQRDNERLQQANTDMLDRTMHAVERTWTPPPIADEPQRDRDDEEEPGVLMLEETGFEDDPLYRRLAGTYADERRREAVAG